VKNSGRATVRGAPRRRRHRCARPWPASGGRDDAR
jgi:hypothetical protein